MLKDTKKYPTRDDPDSLSITLTQVLPETSTFPSPRPPLAGRPAPWPTDLVPPLGQLQCFFFLCVPTTTSFQAVGSWRPQPVCSKSYSLASKPQQMWKILPKKENFTQQQGPKLSLPAVALDDGSAVPRRRNPRLKDQNSRHFCLSWCLSWLLLGYCLAAMFP